MLKNVAGSSFDEINLENGFRILEFQNESDETLTFERNIDSTFALKETQNSYLIMEITLLMY